MNTVSAHIPLTDQQIEDVFDSLSQVGKLGLSELVITSDTLADIQQARESWNEPGRISAMYFQTAGGYPALVILGCRPRKGDTRRTLYVVDFGTVRAAMAL